MPQFKTGLQATIGDYIRLSGVGVHSNKPASITLYPSDPDSGIRFVRTNSESERDVEFRAEYKHVSATALCTVLGDINGVFISTIEHLMAAFQAYGIDNVVVEVDGPEVPILDGSSGCFVEAIDDVGVVLQKSPRRWIKILRPIRIEEGQAYGELKPYNGMRYEIEVEYETPAIGRQMFCSDLNADIFRKDIARARTFGFLKDVEALWAAGFAHGSSLENSIVIDKDDRVLNPEGTRWADEFVRHKTLDAIGDLALAGAPILGCYRSYRGGHRLNFNMIKALFAERDAWCYVEGPVRRDSVGHAEISFGIGAAAYAPEIS